MKSLAAIPEMINRYLPKMEYLLTIKHKFGKNAALKGTNFTEGATAKERNRQSGGHKA